MCMRPDKIGDHQAITFSIKIEKGNIASEKIATTLEKQILMQCRLNLITKPLNNRLSEIIPSQDLKFSRTESMMQAKDTSPKRRATISNPSWINNNVKQAIGRIYETKRAINNEETVAEYIEAKRQVRRIVRPGKTQ